MSVEVTEREKELAKSVVNMLIALGIIPGSKNLSDYERAKERWAGLYVEAVDYVQGIQFIADWIGV